MPAASPTSIARELVAVHIPTGLWRDFRLGDPVQASDLGKLWISLDFRPRM